MTNIVILVGRVARDPETRTTANDTSITTLSLVTDRPARKDGKTYKDENGYTAKDSEFHRITCFNGLGQNVARYCGKGQLVSLEGRIHYTQWEDQDGTKRYGCEIIADKVDFLSNGRAPSNEGAPDLDEDRAPDHRRTRLRRLAPSGPLLVFASVNRRRGTSSPAPPAG